MKNHVFECWLVSIFCCGYVNGVSERELVGNPDDTAKIKRPCPTYDLNCIRNFFGKHEHCKKTFGPVPDPITRPQDNLFLPRINISVTAVDQKVNGLNGRVEEFYINRESDRLVITVEFRNMTQTTDKLYFKFHRRTKEPVVTVTYGSVTYCKYPWSNADFCPCLHGRHRCSKQVPIT